MSRPKLRGLTYEALANDWGIVVCDGSACRKRWPAYRHVRGDIDQYGYMHWSPIHSRMTKSGLRNFLKLVALWRTDYLRHKPIWYRLWRTNVMAYTIAEKELHIRLPAEDSFRDRNRANYLARYVHLRRDFPAAYEWIYYPWRKKDEQARRELARSCCGHVDPHMKNGLCGWDVQYEDPGKPPYFLQCGCDGQSGTQVIAFWERAIQPVTNGA